MRTARRWVVAIVFAAYGLSLCGAKFGDREGKIQKLLFTTQLVAAPVPSRMKSKGLFRRLLRLDDPGALDVCGNRVTTEWAATDVPDSIATADVVWMDCVHVHRNMDILRAKLIKLGIKKPASQQWICATVETSTYYPHLYPYAPLKNQYPEIDLFSTNRLDSDIPLIEIGQEYGVTTTSLLDAPLVPFKDKIPKVMLMYSNCEAKSGRQNYIKRLIEEFPSLVANHGKCWGGSSQVHAYSARGVEEKAMLGPKHMFTFAMENSYITDYVSEKVYQALAEGSVPIYQGAPNAAKDFIPCEHCVIWAADFQTAAELGEFLLYLIANRTAYEEFFAWKKSPRAEVMARLERFSVDSSLCRWSTAGAHAESE